MYNQFKQWQWLLLNLTEHDINDEGCNAGLMVSAAFVGCTLSVTTN